MAIREPLAIYVAATNIQAHIIRGLLLEAGIEAVADEDLSLIGLWAGGIASQLHKPKVWIDASAVEQAKPILIAFEEREAEARAAEALALPHTGEPLMVLCDECGKSSEFPGNLRGSVQHCPHCRAFVDVGIPQELEGWDADPSEVDETDD